MVSNSKALVAWMLCFICSGCQKKDMSRIYKEVQASSLTDQISTSIFDEDLHEFISEDEANVMDNGIIDTICPEEVEDAL